MEPAIIRRAQPCDADAMLPLLQAHGAYEGGYIATGVAALEQALTGAPPRLYGWVADGAERLRGYATAALEFSTWSGRDFLHLDCLFVGAEDRGVRIGGRLMAAVRDHARRLGVAEVQWQTPAWNERAHLFYCQMGAVGLAKQRFIWPVTGTDEPPREREHR